MSSVNQTFIMMNHFQEIGFRIPSTRFMGLGERNTQQPLFLRPGNYSLFADQKDYSIDGGYGET